MMSIQSKYDLDKVKRKYLVRYSLIVTSALIIFLPTVVIADWTIHCVDCPKWFSDFYSRSIDLDSTDRPHITYGGDSLYYAYHDGASWTYETVDSSQSVGQHASSAVDLNDKVHISYYDVTNKDLKYATNKSGSWIIFTIDSSGDVGSYSSLAVDSNNAVHISYYDATNEMLKYSTNMSGDWEISIVDSGGSMGQYTSIAVDSGNYVHISYYDATNFDLKYATNETGSWITETVYSAGNVGSYTSIALDSDNAVHISYYDGTNRNLMYSTNKPDRWVGGRVFNSSQVAGFTSIAIDSGNNVHISYRESGFSENYINYATNASGNWSGHQIDTIGYQGGYSSIVIDSGDIVHIGYFNNLNIKYATNGSGSWVNNIVDSAQSVGKHNSTSLDSNNKVHVSYSDDSTEMVKYATNSSGTWVISTLYPYDMGEIPFISLATDSLNDAHISFNRWESSNRGLLYYATDASGFWSLGGVDICTESGIGKTCNTGIGSSIAIDSNNYQHISYGYYYHYLWCGPIICISETEYALKYATNVSGDWLRNTLTTDVNVGNTSIAIDSNDKVHVSYHNEANNRVGYTYQDEQGWWGGDLPFGCKNPSLAIDSNNKPHIACSTYDQFSNYGSLKYITPDDLVSTDVDASGNVGENASLAIDSNNNLHISYYEFNNKDLRYATNTSGSWIISVIESTGDVGLFNSIAIDSEDNVYISYYDASNHDLKYATNAGSIFPTCECDFTPGDGDVDGSDLAAYIEDSGGISLDVLALEFGRTDCPQL